MKKKVFLVSSDVPERQEVQTLYGLGGCNVDIVLSSILDKLQ